MTTPNGSPTGASPARPRGYSSDDASAQANPAGGGQFQGGSEAQVRGTNQDQSSTGAADATSGLSVMKKGFANPPSESAAFDPNE